MTVRRLVAAVSAAVVAGTAATLGYAAATDTDPQWDTPSSVMVALAAIWLPQALVILARRTTRTERPE